MARTDRSRPACQKFSTRALDDPLPRHADLQPGVDRLLVGPEPQLVVAGEHGDPDVVGGEAETLGRQLPGELARPPA